MSLLDGPLGAVFQAAFGALFRDATLHKVMETDNGAGGFVPVAADRPVKLCIQAIGAADRAASGLPASAVRFIILNGGTAPAPDLDDGLTVGAATYRIIKVDVDPVGASVTVAGVPA